MKKQIVICMFFFTELTNACTGFGVITDHGTLIGRNRDYYYAAQKFELMYPIQQFNNWYENNYRHDNKFYALTSKNNVSMGINQNGLTIIEEDSPMPTNTKANRRFQQPISGTAEGMIKYGILQNFNTIDEIVPFISKIFSVADPQFYQIADAKKILIIEVAYGKNNNDLERKFNYKILTKENEYFAHTNLYLTPEYTSLNTIRKNSDSTNSAEHRLQRISDLILQTKKTNIDIAKKWLLDTHSSSNANKSDPDDCMNLSLFRSNLRGLKSISVTNKNDKIFGTVSSMIVNNRGDLSESPFYLMMLDSITSDSHKKQLIKYKELRTSIAGLFTAQTPKFIEREFVRSLPINGVCN